MIMKFVLQEEFRFWWPVEVKVPSAEKPGKFDKQTLEVEFLAMEMEEARELAEQWSRLKTDEEKSDHEHDLIKRVVVNWRNVDDDDGEAVDFSSDNLDRMLGITFVRIPIYRAYGAAMAGEARAKN